MADSEPISAEEVMRAIPALASHAPTLTGRALGPPTIHVFPEPTIAGLLDHLGSSDDWETLEAMCQALAFLHCPSPAMLRRIETQVLSLLRDWPLDRPPNGALCALAAHTGARFLPLTWDALGEARLMALADHIIPAVHFGVRVALAAGQGLESYWNSPDLHWRLEDLLEAATAPGATRDLLETAECLCCYIRRVGDRRPTGFAAVACRTLLQHWRDKGVGECSRDLAFASVLRVFEYRRELFGLRFSEETVSSRFSAALAPDVLKLHAHARATACAPPFLYRLLARACPLPQLLHLPLVSNDLPRLLGAIIQEASKELSQHLDALDLALDTTPPPSTAPAGTSAVLQHLRTLDAPLPRGLTREYPPWAITYGLHGSPTHSHLLYGLLFGWAAFTDLLSTAGWEFWPAPVSRAVASLALLLPDPPSISRLVLTLPVWTDAARPVDTNSSASDFHWLVKALTVCGRTIAPDPCQLTATFHVCDLITIVGVDCLGTDAPAAPSDLSLHHAVTYGLQGILDLCPILARSRAAQLRAYVQASEASLRAAPVIRAWDSLQQLHHSYLALL